MTDDLTLLLARIQFALTIGFHYIYPPLSIGLGVFLVIVEGLYLKTKDTLWCQVARFWTKVIALTFAIGVATGLVMEFEFGTNWAKYSRFVGDVFGSALAAEGISAFLLESGFLAVLVFGWDKVGPRLHFFATVMVCLGAHFSAVWIVIANSWMQTSVGHHITALAPGLGHCFQRGFMRGRPAERMRAQPFWFAIPVLTMLAVANVPREIFHGREFRAFLSSCAAIGLLVALIEIGLYPNLLLSAPEPAHSLTIVNAASSPMTLRIMLIMAGIGVPLVIAYTIGIY